MLNSNCNNSVTILVKPLKFCMALYIYDINDYQILNKLSLFSSYSQYNKVERRKHSNCPMRLKDFKT